MSKNIPENIKIIIYHNSVHVYCVNPLHKKNVKIKVNPLLFMKYYKKWLKTGSKDMFFHIMTMEQFLLLSNILMYHNKQQNSDSIFYYPKYPEINTQWIRFNETNTTQYITYTT